MGNRRNFIKESAVVAAGLAVTNEAIRKEAKPKKEAQTAYADKLTDDSGKYVALPLPYAYEALEPVIDARTVELHYQYHHKPALAKAKANKADEALAHARATGDFTLVKHHEKDVGFSLSSHILHRIYWTNPSPKGGTPSPQLSKAIDKHFGSFDKLKAYLLAAANSFEGSGWGVLGYIPSTQKLTVLQCENHQKLTTWGVIPLLVLDVWEHTYYLKYRNRRGITPVRYSASSIETTYRHALARRHTSPDGAAL